MLDNVFIFRKYILKHLVKGKGIMPVTYSQMVQEIITHTHSQTHTEKYRERTRGRESTFRDTK